MFLHLVHLVGHGRRRREARSMTHELVEQLREAFGLAGKSGGFEMTHRCHQKKQHKRKTAHFNHFLSHTCAP
jgi:hypothetical protein